MQVLVRNRPLASLLFAAALALALIAALQAQPRLSAPSIPLLDQRIQPANLEAPAHPAAPATIAPQVAPLEREAAPLTPAGEAGERPYTTAVPAPATAGPAPAGAPTSTALPAAQPKVGPADGRPMGDFNLPPPSNNRAWKGGFDY